MPDIRLTIVWDFKGEDVTFEDLERVFEDMRAIGRAKVIQAEDIDYAATDKNFAEGVIDSIRMSVRLP